LKIHELTAAFVSLSAGTRGEEHTK